MDDQSPFVVSVQFFPHGGGIYTVHTTLPLRKSGCWKDAIMVSLGFLVFIYLLFLLGSFVFWGGVFILFVVSFH